MPQIPGSALKVILFICLLVCSGQAFGQSTLNTGSVGQPTTVSNAPQRDTNANKTNTKKWRDDETRISYKRSYSGRTYAPDTTLHTFHRRPFVQPWYNDLGNLGSPVYNLFFTPEDRLGPSLGYHVFDVYRFFLDSLSYYNTTHAYTSFTYQLGSKLEQMAEVMHTQNIKPNWNFMVDYHKINSPGFYKIQRNNHDNGALTTNYKSLNQHYMLYGAMVYNKEQHDENGGIVNDSFLTSKNFNDRKTIPVNFARDGYSITRSSVFNVQRDFGLLLQHSYTWGSNDTLYNKDSTDYTYRLKPRFGITHKMEFSTEKHIYKDLIPDSNRYTGFFEQAFNNGNAPNVDSVSSVQKWLWIDNRIMLNGYIGKDQKQVSFNAGIGNRVDQFVTDYATGTNKDHFISNYLVGELKKEALQPGQWFYSANGKFFLTGDDVGDFVLHAELGKDLKNNIASFVAGFQQQLNSAPYSYSLYENQYDTLSTKFNKESITQVYAQLASERLRLSGGVRNYVISNYIYIDQKQRPDQYATAFSLTQAWIRKEFRLGNFILDNELVYQQAPSSSPVNVPALAGRHQLSFESYLFRHSLKVATGIEARYHTAYYAAGYDPFLNKFYYQNTVYVTNVPEASVFFNFRIKRFRAYLMVDDVQQLLYRNNINFPGYPAQNLAIRFGFNWVMLN